MFYLRFFLKPLLHEQWMLNDPWLPDLYLQAPDDSTVHGHQSKTEPDQVIKSPQEVV